MMMMMMMFTMLLDGVV